jgi:hypothetical protein
MRLLLSLIILTFSSPAFAAACYSAKEAEAEQAIRIHSELMVIGLNCQHMTPKGWKNFYQQYREITTRHQRLITGYEETLISYNSRNGSGNKAERKMHDMRTAFANKTSTDAAKMRPDIFCATYAPRIPKVAKMSTADFQAWAASTSKTERLYHPICN